MFTLNVTPQLRLTFGDAREDTPDGYGRSTPDKSRFALWMSGTAESLFGSQVHTPTLDGAMSLAQTIDALCQKMTGDFAIVLYQLTEWEAGDPDPLATWGREGKNYRRSGGALTC